jgi:hypothetical protein
VKKLDDKVMNELALSYAKVKLAEFEVDKREALGCGSVEMSAEEIQYLKSAYDFAIQQLSE